MYLSKLILIYKNNKFKITFARKKIIKITFISVKTNNP